MAIVFHCPHCGKKIEAVNNAGGKWGKCPACHNKVYVPPKPEQDDDLKLAPVNEAEEERIKQLMAETHRLTQDILEERDTPNKSCGVCTPPFIHRRKRIDQKHNPISTANGRW
jgi:DNA-directed RNA polymerase subunit RPC12/RpoP